MFSAIRKSLRAKLVVLMLASASVGLLVAGASLAVYDARTYHERSVTNLQTQAEILGRASAAALLFDDPRAATEYLELLKARPEFLAAAIYDVRGQLFARYGSAGDPDVPTSPIVPGTHVDAGEITMVRNIVENDRALGSVYLRARYELTRRMIDYIGILAAIFTLSLLAALLISEALQRRITKPIRDITDAAKHVMEKRDFSRKVTKTTEDEIGFLVDSFNDMLAEIGRRSEAMLAADRMKDQFLATLAHELRNPLAPISNALHLLEFAGDKPEIAREARRMMSRQMKQMVRLVDDLLDVSRISTGKLVLHAADLDIRKVIESAIETARPLIESRRQDLTVVLPGMPIYVHGDETRLAQIFSNLLNNAAKYTDAGGRIEFRVEGGAGEARISVTDNGIGIAPEMLPEIFKMFTQVTASADRVQTGLGVGLALSLQLARMHGGSIEALSDGAGRGSRFVVTLPTIRPPELEASGAGARDGAPQERQRILVVDDNQDFAGSLATILSAMGNEVRVEHDGALGLETARAYRPTIAFLDIGLPRLSGYDIARAMRESAATHETVLIAVTGWGQEADKLRAREAGFDLHFVKPLDPAAIPAILQRAADQRSRESVTPR